jgi:hypothetical protein
MDHLIIYWTPYVASPFWTAGLVTFGREGKFSLWINPVPAKRVRHSHSGSHVENGLGNHCKKRRNTRRISNYREQYVFYSSWDIGRKAISCFGAGQIASIPQDAAHGASKLSTQGKVSCCEPSEAGRVLSDCRWMAREVILIRKKIWEEAENCGNKNHEFF